ncbi:MAG: DUF4433 domain-containing protein [Deltaproteobacteria bacterium]|nr:DUF4433 domain-containing protein [Deltaproteobacteria bacterium]
MPLVLTPEKARIFRITHVANVPWILQNGVHCRNSNVRDPAFREIGNPDLIAKRTRRVVPIAPHGTLSDYVPFYFTPRSPMLFNIKTGYNGVPQTPMSEIVVLVSSLLRLRELSVGFVFTDRHAYLQMATDSFSSDLADLRKIDWGILQASDFRRDPDDPAKIERYQAEALVHQRVPVEALTGLACYSKERREELEAELTRQPVSLQVVVRPSWYF